MRITIYTTIALFTFIFGVKAQDVTKDKEYFYYVHAKNYDTNELYITPIQYKKKKYYCLMTEAAICNQFRDYLEAEFSGTFVDISASTTYISSKDGETEKASDVKRVRHLMSLYDKIVRIRNFEFLCE